MNKKIFLTETDKKKIISEKERMIIESFAKIFNKIKRIDENEIRSVGARLRGKEYEIYHKTLSSALEEAENYVNNNYFEIPENGFDKFSYGGVKYGETKTDNIHLNHKGESTKNNFLAIQIYRMDNGTYELNMYLTKMGKKKLDEITSPNLTPDDQEILDDILSINEGLDFNTVIDKVKKYAKMGLLNTAIVMSLLGNPTFTQAQKDQIQNIANIEQTIDNKELSLKDLKNIIKKDDFKASVGRAPLDMVYNKEKGNIDTKFRVYRSVAKNEAAASNSAIIIMKKNEETLPKTTHQFNRTLDNGNIEVMIAVPIN